jgi:hypothetical protein
MWVRLDDSIANHPKFVRAGPEAFGLFVAGLCYCNRYVTAGVIPKLAVPSLLAGMTGSRAMKLAERLAANDAENPSWVDEGDHYRVHDYELYQLPRGDVREQAAERKRRQRARERDLRVTVTRDGHADGHSEVTGGGHTPLRDRRVSVPGDGHAPLPGPLPPPVPVLEQREFSIAPARGAAAAGRAWRRARSHGARGGAGGAWEGR